MTKESSLFGPAIAGYLDYADVLADQHRRYFLAERLAGLMTFDERAAFRNQIVPWQAVQAVCRRLFGREFGQADDPLGEYLSLLATYLRQARRRT